MSQSREELGKEYLWQRKGLEAIKDLACSKMEGGKEARRVKRLCSF